jgi:molybdate transport system substrate-binding protein
MISGGFLPAFLQLAPRFERERSIKIITVRGPSMGESPQSISNRLRRGEAADLLIMAEDALDQLLQQGRALGTTRTPLANSLIALAVKAGQGTPDISSIEGLRSALLQAKSVAVSESASGLHLVNRVFPQLGIADEMRGKTRAVRGEPVGALVARGEAEIGLQQLSELQSVPGLAVAGILPREVQKVTVFAGAVAAQSKAAGDASALLRFLASSEASEVIQGTGLAPLARP